jgi:hypothetical protein
MFSMVRDTLSHRGHAAPVPDCRHVSEDRDVDRRRANTITADSSSPRMPSVRLTVARCLRRCSDVSMSRPASKGQRWWRARLAKAGALRAIRTDERLASVGFAIVLWTMIVAPALHLSHHSADHIHTASAVRGVQLGGRSAMAAPPGAHEHGDGRLHSHDAGNKRETPLPAPPHGADAADHFGLLVLGTGAYVVPPAPGVAVALAPPRRTDRAVPSLSPAPQFARGPPSAVV